MERIDQRRSLDDKKTTLLTAMQEAVSSDYRKLKDIATVLSDVEETRDIANKIMTKYEDKIPQDDDSTVVQPQEAVGGNEDRASDILRNNYSALSQSITEPVRVAKLLHEEVIPDEALSCVMSTRGSVSDSRAVLLKAVRDAVHSNYKHLELFVTVLRKFSETAHVGDTIFEEYSSSLDDNEVDKHGNHKILFPRNMKKEFEGMRSEFGSTFFQVRRIFKSKKNVLDIDDMKELISDWFPDLKPQLSDKTTIVNVAWTQNAMTLFKPSLDQFIEVIDKVEDKHEIMIFSKCENIQFLIPTVLEKRTITGLFIQSSFLSHADILSFSSQLSTNKSLTGLVLSDDSIDDDGVAVLAQSLKDNETLENLVLTKNPDITSDSAQPLAELLLTNKTLSRLYLYHTNIGTDGVLMLMKSLRTNNTLSVLSLDEKHEKICATLPYYEQIRGILNIYK
uniref:CARD domain-containing protein n=1 Tax=Amphimedon queenslandica TaxID=400682 RepID=A0A1X7T308_AMPQE